MQVLSMVVAQAKEKGFATQTKNRVSEMVINLKNMPVYSPMLGVLSSRLWIRMLFLYALTTVKREKYRKRQD